MARLHTPHLSGFSIRPPCAALRPYVQHFWWLDVAAQALDPQRLHPDGASGLLFNFAQPLWLDGMQVGQSLLVAGPQLSSSQLRLDGTSRLMGVRFQAGTGAFFLGTGLDTLGGFNADLPQAEFASLAEILEPLARDEQQALLEAMLLRRLAAASPGRSPVQRLLGEIRLSQGRARIAELLREVPLGQRQLERQFRHQVGLTPKQYARIQRVAWVRLQLQQNASLLDVAFAAGYADQAHCIHDFKAVIGETPGQYRARTGARPRLAE